MIWDTIDAIFLVIEKFWERRIKRKERRNRNA